MKPTLELMFSAKDATRIREIVPTTSIERRMPHDRIVIRALLVAIVLMFLSWLALAQGETKVGVWTGATQRDRIDVVLRQAPKKDATLTFGGPRLCTLTARYESGRGDYSLRVSNGGYCDRLLGGRMKLTADVSKPKRFDLKLELTDDKGVARDAAELKEAKTVVN